MPSSAPGSLDRQTYADLLAYMLAVERHRRGRRRAAAEPDAARQDADPGRRLQLHGVLAVRREAGRRQARSVRALHAGDRRRCSSDPPPGDWLAWRRTYDAHGFSPLTQITPRNVAQLRVAWTWSLPPGSNESVPLEHDGILFTFAFGDKLQALDARTGDLLWQYSHSLAQGAAPNHKRGIALYGDNVYMGTSDAHVIAVDAKTGKLVWDTEIADFTRRESVSAGPLIARGVVMIGTTGTGVGAALGGPQIVGLDANTARDRVARAHDRAARHAGRRQLERRTGREAQRRVGLEHRQLRSRARPRLLRHGQHLRHGPAAAGHRRSPASRTPRSTPTRRSRSIPTPASSSGRSSTFRTISGTSTTRSSAS